MPFRAATFKAAVYAVPPPGPSRKDTCAECAIRRNMSANRHTRQVLDEGPGEMAVMVRMRKDPRLGQPLRPLPGGGHLVEVQQLGESTAEI
jgi:hypothetical protein